MEMLQCLDFRVAWQCDLTIQVFSNRNVINILESSEMRNAF